DQSSSTCSASGRRAMGTSSSFAATRIGGPARAATAAVLAGRRRCLRRVLPGARSVLLPASRVVRGTEPASPALGVAANNQRTNVNWAKDFELAATLRPTQGAIAQL